MQIENLKTWKLVCRRLQSVISPSSNKQQVFFQVDFFFCFHRAKLNCYNLGPHQKVQQSQKYSPGHRPKGVLDPLRALRPQSVFGHEVVVFIDIIIIVLLCFYFIIILFYYIIIFISFISFTNFIRRWVVQSGMCPLGRRILTEFSTSWWNLTNRYAILNIGEKMRTIWPSHRATRNMVKIMSDDIKINYFQYFLILALQKMVNLLFY